MQNQSETVNRFNTSTRGAAAPNSMEKIMKTQIIQIITRTIAMFTIAGLGLLVTGTIQAAFFDTITVEDTGFYSQDSGGFTIVADAAMGGLDLSSGDKLVFTIGVKGGTYPITASYAGKPLTLAVGQVDIDNLGWTGIFYTDDLTATGNLTFSSGGYSGGVSAIVFSGTASGFAGAVSSSQTTATTLNTTSDGSFMVAAYSGSNGEAPGALGELIEVLNVYDLYVDHSAGSGTYVSGYQDVLTGGSYVASFDSSASATRQATVAAEFTAALIPEPSTLILAGLGLAGLALRRRRK